MHNNPMTGTTRRRTIMPLSPQRRFVGCSVGFVLWSLSALPFMVNGSMEDYHYQAPCPNVDDDLMGYSSLRGLNLELQRHASQASTLMNNNNRQQQQQQSPQTDAEEPVYYTYTLCPHTVFNAWSEEDNFRPIVPLLSSTVIRCGRYGDSRDGCLVQGGGTQVLMVGGEEEARYVDVVYLSGNHFSSESRK
jgi:hypothetical protein